LRLAWRAVLGRAGERGLQALQVADLRRAVRVHHQQRLPPRRQHARLHRRALHARAAAVCVRPKKRACPTASPPHPRCACACAHTCAPPAYAVTKHPAASEQPSAHWFSTTAGGLAAAPGLLRMPGCVCGAAPPRAPPARRACSLTRAPHPATLSLTRSRACRWGPWPCLPCGDIAAGSQVQVAR